MENSRVPRHLRRIVLEGGGDTAAVHNELMLYLLDTMAEQNAVLDDTLYEEIRRTREAQERMAEHLASIADSCLYLGSMT